MGVIRIPLDDENLGFHVTITILHMIQMKGVSDSLVHDVPHKHMQKFVDMCSPFSFEESAQESMRLRLFPFSLIGEAIKWLADLSRDSKPSWEEITETFNMHLFPLSKMVMLRNHIQNFERIDGIRL